MPNSAYTFTAGEFFGAANSPQDFINPTSGAKPSGGDPTIEEVIKDSFTSRMDKMGGFDSTDIPFGVMDWLAGEADRVLWGVPDTSTRIQIGLMETTGEKVPLWMEVSATLEENRDRVWDLVGSMLAGAAFGSSQGVRSALDIDTSTTGLTVDDLDAMWNPDTGETIRHEQIDRDDALQDYFDRTSYHEDEEVRDDRDFYAERDLDEMENPDSIGSESEEDYLEDVDVEGFYDVDDILDYQSFDEDVGEDEDVEEDFEIDFDSDGLFERVHDLNVDLDPNVDRRSLIEDNVLGFASMDLILDQPGLVDPFGLELEDFDRSFYELSNAF